ncbi:MAG: response regulator [Longimicrobiales bacterium]
MTAASTILLVEDDHLLRDAFRLLLEEAGYRVREAATASAAIESASTSTPSLILLDLGLPDRPGLDVVRALRSRDATRDTPIIALTGRAGAEEERACLEAGCTHFFSKPLEPKVLLRELPSFLDESPV